MSDIDPIEAYRLSQEVRQLSSDQVYARMILAERRNGTMGRLLLDLRKHYRRCLLAWQVLATISWLGMCVYAVLSVKGC